MMFNESRNLEPIEVIDPFVLPQEQKHKVDDYTKTLDYVTESENIDQLFEQKTDLPELQVDNQFAEMSTVELEESLLKDIEAQEAHIKERLFAEPLAATEPTLSPKH